MCIHQVGFLSFLSNSIIKVLPTMLSTTANAEKSKKVKLLMLPLHSISEIQDCPNETARRYANSRYYVYMEQISTKP